MRVEDLEVWKRSARLSADIYRAMQSVKDYTLRAEKEAFLDPQLTQHPVDLLYAVTLRGGEAGYVYVLFEHKSYVESRINLDLLRYRVRIWEQWLNDGNTGLLPVIVPVVFYHGAARWGVKRQFAATVADAPGLQRYVPACEYHRVDVSGYRDEDLRGAVRLQVALLTLKYIHIPGRTGRVVARNSGVVAGLGGRIDGIG